MGYPTFAHPTNGELCARDGLQCERMVQCSRLRDVVSSTGTERFLPSTHVQADLSRLAVDREAAHSDERKSKWFHEGNLLISISLSVCEYRVEPSARWQQGPRGTDAEEPI